MRHLIQKSDDPGCRVMSERLIRDKSLSQSLIAVVFTMKLGELAGAQSPGQHQSQRRFWILIKVQLHPPISPLINTSDWINTRRLLFVLMIAVTLEASMLSDLQPNNPISKHSSATFATCHYYLRLKISSAAFPNMAASNIWWLTLSPPPPLHVLPRSSAGSWLEL